MKTMQTQKTITEKIAQVKQLIGKERRKTQSLCGHSTGNCHDHDHQMTKLMDDAMKVPLGRLQMKILSANLCEKKRDYSIRVTYDEKVQQTMPCKKFTSNPKWSFQLKEYKDVLESDTILFELIGPNNRVYDQV